MPLCSANMSRSNTDFNCYNSTNQANITNYMIQKTQLNQKSV